MRLIEMWGVLLCDPNVTLMAHYMNSVTWCSVPAYWKHEVTAFFTIYIVFLINTVSFDVKPNNTAKMTYWAEMVGFTTQATSIM